MPGKIFPGTKRAHVQKFIEVEEDVFGVNEVVHLRDDTLKGESPSSFKGSEFHWGEKSFVGAGSKPAQIGVIFKNR